VAIICQLAVWRKSWQLGQNSGHRDADLINHPASKA
jgi:hypothetical protein